MKRRFREEQVIQILPEGETVTTNAQFCTTHRRRHCVPVVSSVCATGSKVKVTPTASDTLIGLKLTYLRDNRAAAPESLVYSQAGNSAPETVTIDIPVGVS